MIDKIGDALCVSTADNMKRYGLIGHPLKHSQSKALFEAKFAYEGLDCRYQNFDLKNVEEIHEVMERYPDLCGFNVTIPYKEAIIKAVFLA